MNSSTVASLLFVFIFVVSASSVEADVDATSQLDNNDLVSNGTQQWPMMDSPNSHSSKGQEAFPPQQTNWNQQQFLAPVPPQPTLPVKQPRHWSPSPKKSRPHHYAQINQVSHYKHRPVYAPVQVSVAPVLTTKAARPQYQQQSLETHGQKGVKNWH